MKCLPGMFHEILRFEKCFVQVRGLKGIKSQPKIPWVYIVKVVVKKVLVEKDVKSKLAIKAYA